MLFSEVMTGFCICLMIVNINPLCVSGCFDQPVTVWMEAIAKHCSFKGTRLITLSQPHASNFAYATRFQAQRVLHVDAVTGVHFMS